MNDIKKKSLKEIISDFSIVELIVKQMRIEQIRESFQGPKILSKDYYAETENLVSSWGQHMFLNLHRQKYELNFAHLMFFVRMEVKHSERVVYDKVYKLLSIEKNIGIISAVNYLYCITKEVEELAFVTNYVSTYFTHGDFEYRKKITEDYILNYGDILTKDLRSVSKLMPYIDTMITEDIINKLNLNGAKIASSLLQNYEVYHKLQKEIVSKPIETIKTERRPLIYKIPPDMPKNKISFFHEWEKNYFNSTLKQYRCPNKYCGGMTFEFNKFEHRPPQKEKDKFIPPMLPGFPYPDREWMVRMNCQCCRCDFMVTLDNNAYTLSFGDLIDEWVQKEKPRLLAYKMLLRNAFVPLRRIIR